MITRRGFRSVFFFVVILLLRAPAGFSADLPPESTAAATTPNTSSARLKPAPAAAQVNRANGQLPLYFEANQGQTDPEVRFLARGVGYTLFLTPTEAVMAFHGGRKEQAVVRMSPVGANALSRIVGGDELTGKANYLRSTGSQQRISAVPTHAAVKYVDVYPGVDLVYSGREGQLEYDFVLAPGADPNAIVLSFEGPDRLELNTRGDLLVHTTAGELRQVRPVIYQDIDGVRREVPGRYELKSPRHVAVRVGPYDPSRSLVIDPVLVYSTYLGGRDDEAAGGDVLLPEVGIHPGFGVAVDTAGNAYVTGTTRSLDFPTTAGADQSLGGNQDAFVTKLSPSGAVIYSTYLGGSCDALARAIAVDSTGNAYVTGRSVGCSFGDPSGVLVAKLSPTGAVLYFFVFGAALGDTSQGQAIAVDADGNAYVTGRTGSGFPTTLGAPCSGFGDLADGFVAKVNAAGNALVYSTYLCGTAFDSPNAIAVDSSANAYVAGGTESHDFPVVNALQGQHLAGPDDMTGFVAKLGPDGDLVYSTYLGGSAGGAVEAIALDAQQNVYVTGRTTASDFPTTPGVVQRQAGFPLCGGIICTDAFVTKINAAGSALVYSTYLAAEGHDVGLGIAVDASGNAYVVGNTASIYFPIKDAFQTEKSGTSNAFVVKLNPDATRLVYSSYLGGEGHDIGVSIAVDPEGNAYVAGYTNSPTFPTTPGAFQPQLGRGICDFFGTPCGDAFVTKIAAGGPGVVPAVSVSVTPLEVAPGGTLTATWAGITTPSSSDRLALVSLGTTSDESLEVWPTTGAGSGSIDLTLPDILLPGTYELRLLTDVNFLLTTLARSSPFNITRGSPRRPDPLPPVGGKGAR